MNVVAFRTNPDPWPDARKLTLPSKKSTAIAEFAGWGANVMAILHLLESDLDCWALFDTFDHPAETFYKGRMCATGDAAHATTPHHGSGAGCCIEDSAVMAELLVVAAESQWGKSGAGGSPMMHEALEKAFATFEHCRKERTQWLVRSSRMVGDLYEWRGVVEGPDSRTGERVEFGRDIEKIAEEVRWRCDKIWDADVGKMVEEAREELETRLKCGGGEARGGAIADGKQMDAMVGVRGADKNGSLLRL